MTNGKSSSQQVLYEISEAAVHLIKKNIENRRNQKIHGAPT